MSFPIKWLCVLGIAGALASAPATADARRVITRSSTVIVFDGPVDAVLAPLDFGRWSDVVERECLSVPPAYEAAYARATEGITPRWSHLRAPCCGPASYWAFVALTSPKVVVDVRPPSVTRITRDVEEAEQRGFTRGLLLAWLYFVAATIMATALYLSLRRRT